MAMAKEMLKKIREKGVIGVLQERIQEIRERPALAAGKPPVVGKVLKKRRGL